MVTTRRNVRLAASPGNNDQQLTADATEEVGAVHRPNSLSTLHSPASDSTSTSKPSDTAPEGVASTSSSLQHSHPASRRRRALADLQSCPALERPAVIHDDPQQKQQHALKPLLHAAVTKRQGAEASGSLRVRRCSKGHVRHRARGKHAGLIGRVVDVPADVFSVNVPDMFYRGLITKRDYAHKDSFEVKFLEDGTRYWLPIAACQGWIDDMTARGRSETSQTVGAAGDEFAASILAGFAGSEWSRPTCAERPWSAAASDADSGSFRDSKLLKCHSEPDISNLQRLAAAV